MIKLQNKIFSMLLAVVLTVTMLPLSAFAMDVTAEENAAGYDAETSLNTEADDGDAGDTGNATNAGEPSDRAENTNSSSAAVVVDGSADVDLDPELLKNEDGSGYDFSKLDLTNTDVFENGEDDAYLVTIDDETRLVGDTTLKRWTGSWETWQNYIHPDESTLAQYPYLEEVWDLAYPAYIAAFKGTPFEDAIKQMYPDVAALKNYWYDMTDTKGVVSIEVETGSDAGYTLSWKDKAGTVLASDSYTMTGKMVKGLEGAAMYIFTADTLDSDSDYKYLVTMDPGMEGEGTTPIAAHYHFQFGSSLSDLLKYGETYNGTESNINNAKWYATMIDGKAFDLAKYNVILGMHQADKWTTIVVDGTDVSGLLNQEELKDEDGAYQFSRLNLEDTSVFQNGPEDAYLVTIGGETRLIGDKTLKRWAGSWETWQKYIDPDAAMLARYPYLNQVWDLAYPAYLNAFKGTPLEDAIK